MTNLLRAALAPRTVRPVLLAIVSTTLLCAAFAAGSLLSRPDIVVRPAPVVVTPPAVVVPPAHVTVAPAPVVMPATPVVVKSAPPAPDPSAPAPQPRALVPTLDAACVIHTDGAPSPTCAWDDGFPAISADGTLIATKYVPGMGPSDLDALSIHFLDTRTSQVVRDSVILTPEESVPFVVKNAASSEDKLEQQRQRVLGLIYRRVAAVQRTLDDKRFRTLRALGSARSSMGSEATAQRGPHPVYAEIVGTTARIIDSEASQVLWRGEFWASEPKRSRGDCSIWTPWSIELWWDPETRHVLAAQTYRTGGCMCPDVPVETVQQMP
ncbi:MAG TPA: hypothetical protein VHT91_21110 [Kofleriaceae bacterium]|nr:hypothetical protein [Kofleriaceae bacterium]